MTCVLDQLLGMFLYGITTFLSPCSLALVSVYLTYSVGVSKDIRKGFLIGCSFAIAMCLVFFSLGYAIVSLVPTSFINSRIFFVVSGVLLMLFGANNLRLFKEMRMNLEGGKSLTERLNALKLGALTRFSSYNYLIGSFLFGLVISVTLGPCSISLVLPALLFTLFATPTPLYGGLLLLAFGFGHSLPVIILSALLATARQATGTKIVDLGDKLTRIFGAIFLIVGLTVIVYGFGGW